MTVTPSLILDLVVLVLLVLSFVQGIRRGFIMTLCSLLAVFVALAGGWFLVHQYAQPLQERLEPVFLERFAPEYGAEDAKGQEDGGSFLEGVQEQAEDTMQAVQTAVAVQQCRAMAALVSRAVLFLAGFLAVLVIWLILCRVLDLAARLPGLHAANKVLGGVLGLVKGLILLMVLRWLLCDLLGWIPPEVAEKSYLLPILSGLTLFSLPGR